MRWPLALLVLAACDAGTDLEPGEYHLRITADQIWLNPDPWYDVANGGGLRGHGWLDALGCEATLSADAMSEMTADLERADVLHRGDIRGDCVDNTVWTVAIDAPNGTNSFRYDDCDEARDAALNSVIALLDETVVALHDAGACTACPPELDAASCYLDEPATARFCRGADWQECSDATAGVVVPCDRRPSLQCDPTLGWVPATTWTLSSPTIYRWTYQTSTIYEMSFDLDVDNRGWYLDLTSLPEHLDARDAAGGPVSLSNIIIHPSVFEIPPDTQTVVHYGMQIFAPAAEAIETLAIHERPWDGSPFSSPLAVPHVDGPPPI